MDPSKVPAYVSGFLLEQSSFSTAMFTVILTTFLCNTVIQNDHIYI